MLMKAFEENDYEIESLKNHIESRDAVESSHTHIVKNTNKGKIVMQESQPQNSTSIASLSVQQLQEMIANSIKTQNGGPAHSLCIPNHIQIGSTISECRMDTNHSNSNSLMERVIQDNKLLTSLKHV